MMLTKEQHEEEIKRWENRIVKTCNVCGGLGSVKEDDGLSVMCECMKKVMINAYLVSVGVPRKYVADKWNWDTCVNESFVTECKNYASNFVNNYMDGMGLYFYGSQGRGKSTMESLIAKDVVGLINPDTCKRFSVAFFIFEELVQISLNSTKDRLARTKLDNIIAKTDLLIIDNIGSETGLGNESKHNVRLLEYILRQRDNACLPVIISSNFEPDELSKHYSDTVQDFITQNCEKIFVSGNNFRKREDVSSAAEDVINEFKDFADFDDF